MMKTEKEKMILGEMYIPADPVLVQEREQARILTRKLNDTPEEQLKERSEIVKELFERQEIIFILNLLLDVITAITFMLVKIFTRTLTVRF